MFWPPSCRLNDLLRPGAFTRVNGNDVPNGFGDGTVTFLMMIRPHVFSESPIGAMKSLISDVKDDDDRDFTYTEPNDLHGALGSFWLGMIPAAVMLIAASPNRAAAMLPPPPSVLTIALFWLN